MNTLRTKIPIAALAGVLLCMASNILAQDVPGRWFLGLDAGLALQGDITVQDTGGGKLSFDPGLRVDLSGGVQLARSWKAEVELGFIYNGGNSVGDEPLVSHNPDYCQVPLMGNVSYTLPLRGPVSAYVGAGIGGVWGVLWHDILGSEDGVAFGYQAFAGVKYALNEDLDLGLAYKFLGTTEHDLGSERVDGAFSHSILAAITFKF